MEHCEHRVDQCNVMQITHQYRQGRIKGVLGVLQRPGPQFLGAHNLQKVGKCAVFI